MQRHYVISLNNDPPILKYFWKNSTPSLLGLLPSSIYIYQLNISDGKITKTKLVQSLAQKMKLSMKNFFRKCDQIRKKYLMENFIFCAVSKTWQSKKLFSAVMWAEKLKEHIEQRNKQTKKKETRGAWNSSNIQGRPNFIVLRSAQKHYYCPSQFN